MNWLKNKKNRAITALIPAAVLLFAGACTREPDPAEISRHQQEIEDARAAKDRQFRNPATSPVNFSRIKNFTGLKYFPVDYNFRVPALLSITAEPEHFRVQTSTSEERVYVRTGRLRFTLNGEKHTLMTYQEANPRQQPDPNRLFIPFTDETTGKESYGGGRYLETRVSEKGKVVLDFNQAYNPYCNYSYKYSCPIPPAENRLPIKITAGERVYK